MSRPKTIPELRAEIQASSRLQARSQVKLSHSLNLNQATVSRILRGHFRRLSPAVAKICAYAAISCNTNRPLEGFAESMHHLVRLTRGRSPRQRQAMKLIRLAAELLESEPTLAVRSTRPRRAAS